MREPSLSHAPRTSPPGRSRGYFKQLRRRCESRLAALGIDAKDRNIRMLKDRLSEFRGRPIQLVPMSIPPHSLNGLWVATPMTDFVIYAACATPAHQEHISAHELGHIMCDHQSVSDLDDGILDQLFPDISPAIVRKILMRNTYSHHNEQEAEMIASLYRPRIEPRNEDLLPSAPDDEVIARLRTAIAAEYQPGTDVTVP